jgi:DNA-binding response OmpR family regulator
VPRSQPLNKTHIFIVDEEVVSMTVAAILSRHDFVATAFTESVDALNAVRANPPDLLIAELGMSPLSGMDVPMLLQKAKPECKLLLFSGSLNSEESLKAARDSGLEFETIPKPVNPKQLLKKVLEMMTGVPSTAAKDRAVQTYNDNAQETLSQLRADIAKPKTGIAE